MFLCTSLLLLFGFVNVKEWNVFEPIAVPKNRHKRIFFQIWINKFSFLPFEMVILENKPGFGKFTLTTSKWIECGNLIKTFFRCF